MLFCRSLNAEWKIDKEDKRKEMAVTKHLDKKSLDLKFNPKGLKRFFSDFTTFGGFDTHRRTQTAEQQPGPQ